MHVAVNSHALPVYKKNRIASLLCIFETTILESYLLSLFFFFFFNRANLVASLENNLFWKTC